MITFELRFNMGRKQTLDELRKEHFRQRDKQVPRPLGERVGLPVFDPDSKVSVIAAHMSKRDGVGKAGV